MAFFKAFIFAAVVGYISAQVITAVHPVASVAPVALARHYDDESGPASYHFSYSVDAPETGDSKSQEEVRDGDQVHGYYSLVEPDGTLRRVDYTADDVNGFQAVVSRTPGAARAIVQPVQHVVAAAPVVHAPIVSAPIVHSVTAAPVYRAAPLIRTVQAAPLIRTSPYIASAPVVHSVSPAPLIAQAPLVHSVSPAPLIAQAPLVHSVSPAPIYSSPILSHSIHDVAHTILKRNA